ncbi:MAG: hypothetical protein HUU29_05245 [Planctomycetaceae bacterium]|nr:hypothetical protein [Planctomycetaceae bacterium]
MLTYFTTNPVDDLPFDICFQYLEAVDIVRHYPGLVGIACVDMCLKLCLTELKLLVDLAPFRALNVCELV